MLSAAETTKEKFMHRPLKKHVHYLRNQRQQSNNEDGENHKNNKSYLIGIPYVLKDSFAFTHLLTSQQLKTNYNRSICINSFRRP